jgi:hypothetical protein
MMATETLSDTIDGLSETHSRVMRLATFLLAGIAMAQKPDDPDAQQELREACVRLTRADQQNLLALANTFGGLSAAGEETSDGDD